MFFGAEDVFVRYLGTTLPPRAAVVGIGSGETITQTYGCKHLITIFCIFLEWTGAIVVVEEVMENVTLVFKHHLGWNGMDWDCKEWDKDACWKSQHEHAFTNSESNKNKI